MMTCRPHRSARSDRSFELWQFLYISRSTNDIGAMILEMEANTAQRSMGTGLEIDVVGRVRSWTTSCAKGPLAPPNVHKRTYSPLSGVDP